MCSKVYEEYKTKYAIHKQKTGLFFVSSKDDKLCATTFHGRQLILMSDFGDNLNKLFAISVAGGKMMLVVSHLDKFISMTRIIKCIQEKDFNDARRHDVQKNNNNNETTKNKKTLDIGCRTSKLHPTVEYCRMDGTR